MAWKVSSKYSRRRADLVGEVAGQALVAGVDLGFDLRVAAQQVFDAFGAHGGGVVHAARTGRPCPQHPAVAVADHGRLDRVLLLLARHERLAAGPVGPRSAHLHLRAVDPQGDALGSGVGEHVGQGLQPDARPVGHGEAPLCEQGRTSCTARVTVDRSTPNITASTWCGSWKRNTTRVTNNRSAKTRWWLGPAPVARWRARPPRGWRSTARRAL